MLCRNRNIFLIGLMAVGKSTIGRMLALELGLEFHDVDRVIEERAGADIAWIFDVEGEAGFRDREAAVIDELTQLDGVVLATGGGAVTREANRKHLAERGTVVLLESPIDRLVERTRHDKKRPLLKQGKPKETLERLARERMPFYESIADLKFVADKRSPGTLTREIAERLRSEGLQHA